MSNLKILVDYRENKLIECFNNQNTSIEVKNLLLGDVVINDENNETLFIIERKTLKDLHASIKDGRYHDQKYRLFQNYDKKQIVYIIENYSNFNALNDSSIESSIIHSILRDDIRMFFTKNENDTSYIISCICKRIDKNPHYFKKSYDEKVIKNYNNASMKKSTEYNDIQMRLFSQIPGISNNTATTLFMEFKSFNNLITKYHNHDHDQIKSELNKIKVNGRKINSNAVDNIMKNLFRQTEI